MKKIELVETYNEGDRSREYLSCQTLGVPAGRFIVKRLAASDEAWEAVKERLFGDPAPEPPEGVAVASDGRMYAPGDVVRGLPDAEWERRTGENGGWHIDSNDFANGGAFYEVRRRPTPRTERVAWHDAKGRTLPNNLVIDGLRSLYANGAEVWAGGFWTHVDPDGMVTVLAEDGPR